MKDARPIILAGALAHPVLDAMVRAIRQAHEKGAQGKGPSAVHKPLSEVTVHAK